MLEVRSKYHKITIYSGNKSVNGTWTILSPFAIATAKIKTFKVQKFPILVFLIVGVSTQFCSSFFCLLEAVAIADFFGQLSFPNLVEVDSIRGGYKR